MSARSGEIVGLTGLAGSGQSELLMGLFGAYGRHAQGRIWIDGMPARIETPRDAIRHGLALCTGDRKATGLVLSMSVLENLTLASLARFCPVGFVRPSLEREASERTGSSLDLRAASLDVEVGELSGGNQQKAALGKWLLAGPRVLMLDEPTRGVDIGAKFDIHQRLRALAAEGMGIVVSSSDVRELFELCDRILVLSRGRVETEFDARTASANDILRAAMTGAGEGARA
jgi:ABC-type sugar transport system ATPase subunit